MWVVWVRLGSKPTENMSPSEEAGQDQHPATAPPRRGAGSCSVWGVNDVISSHHLLPPDGIGTGDIAHVVRRLPSSSIPGRRAGMGLDSYSASTEKVEAGRSEDKGILWF